MENRNLYKLDDFLLIVSGILIIPALFFAWPWLKGITDADNIQQYILKAPEILGPGWITSVMYLIAAISSQAGGRFVRHQEKLSLRILDEIGYSRRTRVSDLASQLGMSEHQTRKLLKKLSGISNLNLNMDGDRVSRTRASIKHDSSLEPKSPYSVDKSASKFRSDEVTEKKEQTEINTDLKPVPSLFLKNENGKMGTMPFLLLIILFLTPLWPAALIYIIRKAVKNPPSKTDGT